MRLEELEFVFPEELVATQPSAQHRVLLDDGDFAEIDIEQLLERFQAGDVLVVNDTKVMRRRVFTEAGLEILFLQESGPGFWQVLMPLQKLKRKTEFILPGGIRAEVVERGRPQTIRTSELLTPDYFEKFGELPLPPYIQKARGERRPVKEDNHWYQTDWAVAAGSLAAPTASLHFQKEHLNRLRNRGVQVLEVTLHVGLGTFLEIAVEDLSEHQMHQEEVQVSASVWQALLAAREAGGKVWALGTTVTRTIESVARGMIPRTENGFFGKTDLFIKPGDEFLVTDHLITNFHQPRSTLLALVGAFAGLERVKSAYAWAIDKKFKLFSYGDVTVWTVKE